MPPARLPSSYIRTPGVLIGDSYRLIQAGKTPYILRNFSALSGSIQVPFPRVFASHVHIPRLIVLFRIPNNYVHQQHIPFPFPALCADTLMSRAMLTTSRPLDASQSEGENQMISRLTTST